LSATRSSREGSPPLELVLPTGEGTGELERLRDLAARLKAENAQLQTALDSRIVIEQAKGYLAGRFGVDVDQAFELLRRAARSNRMSLHLLAAAVVGAGRRDDS
jgi:hypothetical protein